MNPEEANGAKDLQRALDSLKKLEVPTHLQAVALEYLLKMSGNVAVSGQPTASSSTGDLRSFISTIITKGAVSEIPCLVFWARQNEGKHSLDEKGIIELYRRAGLRPPKNVTQSVRDLCSKKYQRLEVVQGQPGFVSLSRVGEDFVLHDATSKK